MYRCSIRSSHPPGQAGGLPQSPCKGPGSLVLDVFQQILQGKTIRAAGHALRIAAHHSSKRLSHISERPLLSLNQGCDSLIH